jgi:hypothetical protein
MVTGVARTNGRTKTTHHWIDSLIPEIIFVNLIVLVVVVLVAIPIVVVR